MPWRRLALISLSSAGAGLLIWLATTQRLPWAPGDRQRSTLNQQPLNQQPLNQQLLEQLSAQPGGQRSSEQEMVLLKRLLALGHLQTAQLLMETRKANSPLTVQQRLLMANLQRLNGDNSGARKELDQLLRLHPNHLDVLALQALIDQQEGQGKQALQRLEQRFSKAPAGQRTDLGLLVADLQRQSGKAGTAANLYKQLAQESPSDARPLIALAMLRRDQGKPEEVQELLHQARQRKGSDGVLIDDLAARWGVTAARTKGLKPEQTPKVPTTKEPLTQVMSGTP